jgi:hypothetical protein
MIKVSKLTEFQEKFFENFLGLYNELLPLENFGSSFLLTRWTSFNVFEYKFRLNLIDP